MQSVQITRTGGPEVLETIERPVPTPGPGEVLVKAHAIGVAYFDMLIRSGRYPWMPKLPYVLGNEMSGHVVDTNTTDFKKGQPVYVEGRLKYGKYTDKDGVERNTVDIIATEMQLLGKREGMGGNSGDEGGGSGYSRQSPAQRSPAPAAAPRQAPAQAQSRPASGFDDMDDDIPF